MVCETLKYRPVLRKVIDATKLLKFERNLSPLIAEVLVHDFLFGKGINVAPKKLKVIKCDELSEASFIMSRVCRSK